MQKKKKCKNFAISGDENKNKYGMKIRGSKQEDM